MKVIFGFLFFCASCGIHTTITAFSRSAIPHHHTTTLSQQRSSLSEIHHQGQYTTRVSSIHEETSSFHNDKSSSSSLMTTRRDVMWSSLLLTAGAGIVALVDAPLEANAAVGGDGATATTTTAAMSPFEGTFSDPINHPGGTRTIRLLPDKIIGEYQLAEVIGGGGVGEPKNYILPAIILGNRAIIIDFSPKGGPRDFTGVLDGNNKDIKFLRDGNRWPRIIKE